jgi:putative tryptophan/tyrosine transport system substrate-binding protein
MRESCKYGSVRGAGSNPRPYRNRREFIAGLGSAAAWPVVARAQQSASPVIGLLANVSPGAKRLQVAAFHRGLNETGYAERRNLGIEYRWAEGHFDRLPAMAADLVGRRVAVIFVNGAPGVHAVKAETTTIPVVFSIGEDPVKEGLVLSLNRPGGNVTGFTNFQNQLGSKKLSLLRDIVPKPAMLALLVNPTNPNAALDTKDLQAAAHTLAWPLEVFKASDERDFEPAFDAMTRRGAGALYVNTDPVFQAGREQIVALAARHALPAIYERREFPEAGGLMSYAASEVESFRQCGVYVGRILNGAKPADLPVQEATRFEFVINIRSARALGLTIPETLLATADEVIE